MSLNYPALLLALGMLESGNDDLAVGDHGKSRGRYQIGKVAWVECYRTGKDFAKLARLPNYSEWAAKQILGKRMDAFTYLFGKDPTPQQVYILWNAPSQVNKPSRKVRDRAERFANLYEKYSKDCK